MSGATTKPIVINAKELSFKNDQLVDDLLRFLLETLPQLKADRNGTDIEIEMPIKLSKRVVRLRIKKFLYKKGIDNDFRPISLQTADKDGYTVKEKKILELSYY